MAIQAMQTGNVDGVTTKSGAASFVEVFTHKDRAASLQNTWDHDRIFIKAGSMKIYLPMATSKDNMVKIFSAIQELHLS